MHEFTAACHTEGCGNSGITLTLLWSEEFGPPDIVVCGPCGNEITDLTGLP